VGNIGTGAATGIRVYEDIPALLNDFSVPVLAKPPGAVDSSTATGGANGQGFLDVNSFSLLPTESSTVVYTAVVSDSAADKDVIDNVVFATHSQSISPSQTNSSVTVSVPTGPIIISNTTNNTTNNVPTNNTTNNTANNTTNNTVNNTTNNTTNNQLAETTTNTAGTQTTSTNTQTTNVNSLTQPVVVPTVGADPSLIALGGSSVASLIVGAGYYLKRRRQKKRR